MYPLGVCLLVNILLSDETVTGEPFWPVTDTTASAVHTLTLSDLFTNDNDVVVDRLIKLNQAPSDCSLAKYLVVDENPNFGANGAGWGWSFWHFTNWLLQALVENRVLVFSSNVKPNWRWRWCEHPPYSFQCYFEHWSPCEGYFAYMGNVTVEKYKKDSIGQIVGVPGQYIAGSASETTLPLFHKISHAIHSRSTPRGRIWWMERAVRVLLRAQPWFEYMVNSFIVKHTRGEPFIALHIRRGHKFIEEKPIDLIEYQFATNRISNCLGVRHILLMTESDAVVKSMSNWGLHVGLNIFFTNNSRTDADVWNTKLRERYGIPIVSMDVEGYVAAFNLWASRAGRGYVGTMQSSWGKITVALMQSFSGAVPVLSLRPGFEVQDLFKGQDTKYIVVGYNSSFTWHCTG